MTIADHCSGDLSRTGVVLPVGGDARDCGVKLLGIAEAYEFSTTKLTHQLRSKHAFGRHNR